jgi:uncharacterized protein YndB with AHSA1/START domain
MPSFDASTTSAAPPEEVWKILYDPSRFPEWWVGIETVQPGTGSRTPVVSSAVAGDGEQPGDVDFTMYPTGYPDFPMPQRLTASRQDHRVVISCLVSDLSFQWSLDPLRDGSGTRISVHVDIPAEEAHRLDGQHEVITASLGRLAGAAG